MSLSGRAVDSHLVVGQGPLVTKVFAALATQVSVDFSLYPLVFGVRVEQTGLVNTSVMSPKLFLVHKTAHTESANKRIPGTLVYLLCLCRVPRLHDDSEIQNVGHKIFITLLPSVEIYKQCIEL